MLNWQVSLRVHVLGGLVERVGPVSSVDLIDTTEMYLKTIYEMGEDGVTPMRARIVERLGHSGPTVSQTIARMERDGLVSVRGDRRLELTDAGSHLASEVVRKHRLAECLLISVIGLNWADAHDEACRWEHVMSREVEERLNLLLGHPKTDPYGNAIPPLPVETDGGGLPTGGRAEGFDPNASRFEVSVDQMLLEAADRGGVIARIGEPIQAEQSVLRQMAKAGIGPGTSIAFSTDGDTLELWAVPMSAETDQMLAPRVRLSTLFAPHLFLERQ